MTLPRPTGEVRQDLPWLRRRTLRTRVAAAPAPAGTAARGAAPSAPAQATPAPSAPAPSAPAPSAPVRTPARSLTPPAASGTTSPDLSTAATPGPAPAAPRAPSTTSLDLGAPEGGSTARHPGSPSGRPTSLDLGAPAPRATSPGTAPRATGSTSLDLAAAPATAPSRRPRPAPRSAAAGDLVLAFDPPRVRAGSPVVLGPGEPVVVLTALQSGVGALTVEAACSDAVGDLRLACAYRLGGGRSSLVAHSRDVPVAGMTARRPVIVSSRERYEQLVVDLRQVRSLDRLVVLAYSESGAVLDWGGTLVVHGFGGVRVEVPLRHEPSAGVLVALSVLRVDGELVLRAEDELVAGTLRDACTAHGFEEITWVDTRTPLV